MVCPLEVRTEKFARPAAWGFEHVRVHGLKDTLGQRLRAAGVGEETRKILLGHTNGVLRVTKRIHTPSSTRSALICSPIDQPTTRRLQTSSNPDDGRGYAGHFFPVMHSAVVSQRLGAQYVHLTCSMHTTLGRNPARRQTSSSARIAVCQLISAGAGATGAAAARSVGGEGSTGAGAAGAAAACSIGGEGRGGTILRP